jgi:predicted DNA-binding protein with PD1-like motif
MKSRLLASDNGSRTFVLVFAKGDRVMDPLKQFLRKNAITAARLSGIGALESVTLGYFDWVSKRYERHRIDEQLELLALSGDVALDEDGPQVHAHVVVGHRDMRASGGHLIDATVRPTLELIIEDAPAHLRKLTDKETGLALIAPNL